MVKTAGKSQKGEKIRASLVKKFRKQIRNQSYEIKSGEIAGRMAAELFASNTVVKGPTR
jgi:anti-sigma28 factor (negative regulator of flagellin synthesis)